MTAVHAVFRWQPFLFFLVYLFLFFLPPAVASPRRVTLLLLPLRFHCARLLGDGTLIFALRRAGWEERIAHRDER